MSRKLYTLAYPTLAPAAREFIDRIRNEHDLPYRDVVKPHFTMVFSCDQVEEKNYQLHVRDVSKNAAPIAFHCRYAMLGADDEAPLAYVFLVPDDGFSGLSLLHDRLYTGLLASKLRLDLEFIPHITIATLEDRAFAKSLCDRLNDDGLSIAGSVDSLTVAALEANRVQDIATFALSR